MAVPDASFDVVLSNLCLHNIYWMPSRRQAVREIARVLRPGGRAVLSDYKHMREYAAELEACGLDVRLYPLDWTGTFPPLRILVAEKFLAADLAA
jgi:arsenite methyltransferase